MGNWAGSAISLALLAGTQPRSASIVSTSTLGTPDRAPKNSLIVSSLRSPFVPRWTITVSPSCPLSRSSSTTGIIVFICRLTSALTTMPLAASSSAAPSITESPMAMIGGGGGGSVVVGGDRRRRDAWSAPAPGPTVSPAADAVGSVGPRPDPVSSRGRRVGRSPCRSRTQVGQRVASPWFSASDCGDLVRLQLGGGQVGDGEHRHGDERRRRSWRSPGAGPDRGRPAAGATTASTWALRIGVSRSRYDTSVIDDGDRHGRRRTAAATAGCRPPAGSSGRSASGTGTGRRTGCRSTAARRCRAAARPASAGGSRRR